MIKDSCAKTGPQQCNPKPHNRGHYLRFYDPINYLMCDLGCLLRGLTWQTGETQRGLCWGWGTGKWISRQKQWLHLGEYDSRK